MSISDTGLRRLMREKLAYLSQRQALLAENVASANIPGYKAKDLKTFTFGDAMNEAQGGGMKVTDPRHIVPASMAGANAASARMKAVETLPSGTTVDLEQQMMEVSKTAIDYQALLAVYQKFSLMFKNTIGK